MYPEEFFSDDFLRSLKRTVIIWSLMLGTVAVIIATALGFIIGKVL